jgi:hypothetical protein
MIYVPKDDGTYVVEFRTAAGEALAISIPRTEAGVIRHFLRAVRAGRSREEPLARPRVSLTEPSNNRPKPPA